MPVEIQVDKNVTLAELQKFKQEGFMVEATPHIGNLGLRNIAAASLGFTVKLVDSTKGDKDNLFFPHRLIVGGRSTEIADSHILTTHNSARDLGVSVSNFHTAKINKYYSSIITQTDWARPRSETILAILDVVNKHDASKGGDDSIWHRYVDANGVTDLRSYNSSTLPEKIIRLTSVENEEGWLTSNPVNLLCDIIVGVLDSGRDTVYMISDQTMYRYMFKKYRSYGPMNEFISELYDVVRASGLFDLPEQLHVSMVPLSCLANFVAPKRLANDLDRKLQYFDRLTMANRRAGAKEQQKLLCKKRISIISHKRSVVFRTLSQPLNLVMADPTTGIFYTHHDLLREKDVEVYIPEVVMNTPLSALLALADKMHRQMRSNSREVVKAKMAIA